MLDFTSSNLTQLLKQLKAKPSEKLTFKLQKLTKIHWISGTWTHKPLQLFLLLLLVLQHRLLRGRRWLAVCWQQLAISRQVTAPQKLHLGCVSAQLSAIKTFQNKSKSSQISLMGKPQMGAWHHRGHWISPLFLCTLGVIATWTSFIQHWVSTGQNSHLNPQRDWTASWLASILFFLWRRAWHSRKKKPGSTLAWWKREWSQFSTLACSSTIKKTRHLPVNFDVKVGFVTLGFTRGKTNCSATVSGGYVYNL